MSISLTEESGVATLHLGADENTFDASRIAAVLGLLRELEESGSRAPLLTTADGKYWSNGFDMDWVMDPDARDATRAAGHALLGRMLTLGRPTAAVLQGHAFGLGAMFALAHDYRVVRADRGFLCLPEVDLGIPFTEGMSALAAAKIPAGARLDAMAYGHRFGGSEAAARGLTDIATTEAELPAAAAALVQARQGKDPRVVSAIKRELYRDVMSWLPEAAPGAD